MAELGVDQNETSDPDGRQLVNRPSRHFGTWGFIVAILGLFIIGLALPALILSYIGFRSLHAVYAVFGYVLGWLECLFWAYVLFSVITFFGNFRLSIPVFDDIGETLEGGVLAVRVYQVEHDGELPDDEMGTRILNGSLMPLLVQLFSELDDDGPGGTARSSPTSWKLTYKRVDPTKWRGSVTPSKAPSSKGGKKPEDETIWYEFSASGQVVGSSS